MEVPVIRQFHGHLGSEKQQMLELNKRLESYLCRVKLLEEENELLKDEVQALQGSRKHQAWKGELEGQLREARAEVQATWMERDRVEMEVANLREDLHALQLRRQKEAATQAEARRGLVESKNQMEEERRAQIWLRQKVAQLEKELQLQLETHQEEVSVLQARLSDARPVLVAPPHTEVLCLQDLGQQYSQRATQAWQEAAATYQDQAKRLEDSLSQARRDMAQLTQEKREGSLMVQRLAKDLDGAQSKKMLLEQKISQQRSRELKELEQLQAHLEALEGEKAKMRDQISDILDDRHHLLQLKMSLGMEVATYRALLDNESLRVDKPSINDTHGSLTVDGASSLRCFKQRLQTSYNGSHITTPVSFKLGKRAQATEVAMTMTPVQISKQDTSKHQPKSAGFTEELGGWNVESSQHAVWSTPAPTDILKGNGSMEHFREKEVQEEISLVAALSAATSLNLNATGLSIEKSSIDQPTSGGSDVSRQEIGENKGYSLTIEAERHIALNDTEPDSEQPSAACHSTVFSSEIQAPDSPKVMLNLSGAETNQPSEDFEDMGVKGSVGMAFESAHTPFIAWGEEEAVKEEIECTEGKVSEFELGSGSDVKEIDYAFNSTHAHRNLSGFNQHEQAAERCDSIVSMSQLKADMPSEEVLSHEGKSKEGLDKENENKIKDMYNGDDLPDRFELSENVKDKLVSEEDRVDALDRDNGCKTKADSTDRNQKLGHDNEYEPRETREGMVATMNRMMDCSATEEYKRDLDNEIPVISPDEDADLKIDENPGDIQQEQTSSDAELLDLSEECGDDSQHASHSWTTDGGELESNGSYSLENTLADTRPLIRYKSDETDMNTQASQLGDSDSSGDEGNDDKGCWGEDKRRVITSKSIDFMEDLDEEPERETEKEEAARELIQGEEIDAASISTGKETLMNDDDDRSKRDKEEGMAPLQDETTYETWPTDPMTDPMEKKETEKEGAGGEPFQGEQIDAAKSSTGKGIIIMDDDHNESERVKEEDTALLQDETTVETFPTDPMTDPMDKRGEEENGRHEYVVQESQSLSLYSKDDLKGETVDNEAALGLQTEYCEREETETLQPLDPVNSIREISSQSHSDTEEEVIRKSTLSATLSSLPSELPPHFSGTIGISPAQDMNSDAGTGEGAHPEEAEVFTGRREEDNLSMLANVDFTDELSLHSELSSTMGSIINTANSDLEEYSSGDDSPNVSQFLQPIRQEVVPENHENSIARISPSNLSEDMDKSAGHSFELSEPRPEDVSEEVNDHRTGSDVILQNPEDIAGSPSVKLWGHESFIQSVDRIAECSEKVFQSDESVDIECVTEEKLRAASQPSGGFPDIVSDEDDGIFKVKKTEALSQTNGKCHDHDTLLSTTLHEETWSSSEKKEAAYNPEENLVFGVSWGDTENLLKADEHTVGNIEMFQAPSLAEQKQIPLQISPLSGVKVEEDRINSDDSLEEGDSWSSGEE